jgi:hypothetical protein
VLLVVMLVLVRVLVLVLVVLLVLVVPVLVPVLVSVVVLVVLLVVGGAAAGSAVGDNMLRADHMSTGICRHLDVRPSAAPQVAWRYFMQHQGRKGRIAHSRKSDKRARLGQLGNGRQARMVGWIKFGAAPSSMWLSFLKLKFGAGLRHSRTEDGLRM